MFAIIIVPKDLLLTLFPWERIIFVTLIVEPGKEQG
jgi:hypothetical protein